jgi:hypothetical protein
MSLSYLEVSKVVTCLLTPTEEKAWHESGGLYFFCAMKACFQRDKKK